MADAQPIIDIRHGHAVRALRLGSLAREAARRLWITRLRLAPFWAAMVLVQVALYVWQRRVAGAPAEGLAEAGRAVTFALVGAAVMTPLVAPMMRVLLSPAAPAWPGWQPFLAYVAVAGPLTVLTLTAPALVRAAYDVSAPFAPGTTIQAWMVVAYGVAGLQAGVVVLVAWFVLRLGLWQLALLLGRRTLGARAAWAVMRGAVWPVLLLNLLLPMPFAAAAGWAELRHDGAGGLLDLGLAAVAMTAAQAVAMGLAAATYRLRLAQDMPQLFD